MSLMPKEACHRCAPLVSAARQDGLRRGFLHGIAAAAPPSVEADAGTDPTSSNVERDNALAELASTRAERDAAIIERDTARAEVEMLRGAGCRDSGDGPCGVCISCLRAERDDWKERYMYLAPRAETVEKERKEWRSAAKRFVDSGAAIRKLDELEALHAKATPGEWRPDTTGRPPVIDCDHPDFPGDDLFIVEGRPFGANDIVLIAALHNAFPQMAAELRRLREVERVVRAAIARYNASDDAWGRGAGSFDDVNDAARAGIHALAAGIHALADQLAAGAK